MSDEDGGESEFGVQLFDERKDGSAGFLIQIAGGLIGEEQSGPGDEGTRENDALALTAGKLPGAMVGTRGQTDALDPLGGIISRT